MASLKAARSSPIVPLATEVALAAHEKLLQGSENFWLSSWLRNQVSLLSDAGS